MDETLSKNRISSQGNSKDSTLWTPSSSVKSHFLKKYDIPFILFLNIYFIYWLRWVLVAICELFSSGMWI